MKLTVIPYKGELSPEQTTNFHTYIRELREGGHTQTTGRYLDNFHGQNCYCAIGLALTCMKSPKAIPRFDLVRPAFDFEETVENLMHEFYGTAFRDMVMKPDLDGSPIQAGIVNLNDYVRLNFPQIADVIEAKFIKREALEIEI